MELLTFLTCTVVSRRANGECAGRLLSPQGTVRQAILLNLDMIVSSVCSEMAHAILVQAIDVADSEHRKTQHLVKIAKVRSRIPQVEIRDMSR